MSAQPSLTTLPGCEPTQTIVGSFWDNVDRHPGSVALRHRAERQWVSMTWAEYGGEVRSVANGLRAIGVGTGDRVAIVSDNRVEWHVADIAVMSIGAISVPIYPTNSPAQILHALIDSGSVAVVIDTGEQLAKLETIRPSLANLRHVIALDPVDDASVSTWRDMHKPGIDSDARDVATLDAVATIVYTSGTTGTAKGAALTHRNIAFTVGSIMSVVNVGGDDRFVSFLPLSHIAERVVSHFGQIAGGAETWFARSLATVAEDLHDCRPTIFFAVPRIWEKLRAAIEEQATTRAVVERMALGRYLTVGAARRNGQQTGVVASAVKAAEWAVLDRFVGAAVRRKLGLDKARMLVSGAAPIGPALLRWFAGIGLPIVQAYGQTEDCGPVTLGDSPVVHDAHIGSVGRALPGVQLSIGGDGELLVRGACVCAGYWNNPVATTELVDGDGWMHTGDLGRIDTDGSVWIVGRKKDLIVMANGHKVVPEELEARLRVDSLVLEAVIVGEGRPYLAALITLNPQQLAVWAKAHHKLYGPEDLASDGDVRAAIAAVIDGANNEVARSETIKRFRILPSPFTAADGELTPTAKVKRNVVIQRNAALIDEMYANSEAPRLFVDQAGPTV
jgi:long-chain acyl-CoA synthetase